MFESKESKIELLKWLIGFCNSDLQTIRKNEKERLALHLENFSVLVGSKVSDDEAVFNVEDRKGVRLSYNADTLAGLYNPPPEEAIKHFKERGRRPFGAVNDELMKLMQKAIRNFFDFFIMEKERISAKEKPITLGFQIVRHLVPRFWITRDEFRLIYDPVYGGKATIEVGVKDEESGGAFLELGDLIRAKKEFKRRGIFLSSEKLRESIALTLKLFNWDQFILNFCALLNNVPTKWIQKCKGCRRYFLNPYERKKSYCNASCASRSIARQKYEELKRDPVNYEAHLKKYRKYSKERYKRLRRLQFGPNIRIGIRTTYQKES